MLLFKGENSPIFPLDKIEQYFHFDTAAWVTRVEARISLRFAAVVSGG